MSHSRPSIVCASTSILALGVSDDDDLLLAQAAAFGPSLGLLQDAEWMVIAVGSFADGEGPIRIAVGGANKKLATLALEGMKNCVRAATTGARFGTDLLTGQGEKYPRWLAAICDDHDRLERVGVRDVSIPVPRFSAGHRQVNSLWMARFLAAVEQFTSLAPGTTSLEGNAGSDSMQGLAVLIRPIESASGEVSEQRHRIERLRELFERTSIASTNYSETESTQKKVAKSAKIDGESTSDRESTSYSGHGQDLRTAALTRIAELMRSGAWLTSVRLFGTEALKGATLLWASIANLVRDVDSVSERSVPLRRHRPVAAADATAWRLEALREGFERREAESVKAGSMPPSDARRFHLLRRAGIDVRFAEDPARHKGDPSSEANERGQDTQVQKLLSVIRNEGFPDPCDREMLLSGERLSSLIQLPVTRTASIDIVRGFSYVSSSSPRPAEREALRMGTRCVGGLIPSRSPESTRASSERNSVYIARGDLDMHALVVGATGAGKTSTVTAILREAQEGSRRHDETTIHFVVLEGAKREYRHRIGNLDNVRVLALQGAADQFLSLNLFEHPPSIAPEVHISQLASLFESTLEMPQPVPAIVREALSRAYADYHNSPPDSPLRRAHPINYWLTRAVTEVQRDTGYTGEIGANIGGILRTRLSQLCIGSAARVLDSSVDWSGIQSSLSEQSLILELESIADSRSRALVMSLFVLYFRYAIEERSRSSTVKVRLRNLLVLEEAHRIIGRRDHGEGSNSNEYFAQMLSEVRAFGCGIIISDQSPSKLIDDAMRNTNTKVIMRLVSGDDIESVVRGAGLPESAVADIPRLQVGQGLVINASGESALVKFDSPSHATATEGPNLPSLATERSQLAADVDVFQQGQKIRKALTDKSAVERRRWKILFEDFGCTPDDLEEFRRIAGCSCAMPPVPSSDSASVKSNDVPWCEAHGRDVLEIGLVLRLEKIRAGHAPPLMR